MRNIILVAVLFTCAFLNPARAAEMYNVEYLCADWGPSMKLPTKSGENPQFSDTEEEIYFIKQLGSYTKILGKTEGHGVNIYLCKMRPDGSAKTEIKELWHDVRYPIDTQAQSTWMNVNAKTGKIALSIIFAGSDLTGLWTINLDGSDLKSIIASSQVEGHWQAIDSPSWTPDGQRIVFGESLRGVGRGRITKCDTNGNNRVYLTEGPGDCQPRVSPDGRQVAYIHQVGYASRLYLMNADGSNQHPLPNPDDKRWRTHGGTYPAWSPDGTMIYALSAGIIDVATGKTLNEHRPVFEGKPWAAEMAHWGKLGLLGSATSFRITLTDPELTRVKALALSGESKTRDTFASSSDKE